MNLVRRVDRQKNQGVAGRAAVDQVQEVEMKLPLIGPRQEIREAIALLAAADVQRSNVRLYGRYDSGTLRRSLRRCALSNRRPGESRGPTP